MLRQGVDLANAVAAHLQEVTGQPARLEPCPHTPLPAYLAHGFDLACGDVLGVACVFATPLRDTTRAPAALEKRLARLAEAFGRPAVLVLDDLPARDRQRLMARRVPFIVPFVHAYLPPVFIDSRERARPRGAFSGAAPETLAPTTQLLLLHALLAEDAGDLYAQELTRALDVSAMSVSRALKELEAAGLITRPREGRPRPARLTHSKRATWQQAQPLLRSPVRARYLTAERPIPGALEAGLSALARLSDLAAGEPTAALSTQAWRELEAELEPEPFRDGALEPHHTLVEVWAYDPRALTPGLHVDLLSLYLSLRDTHDERVEAALEQALEALPW